MSLIKETERAMTNFFYFKMNDIKHFRHFFFDYEHLKIDQGSTRIVVKICLWNEALLTLWWTKQIYLIYVDQIPLSFWFMFTKNNISTSISIKLAFCVMIGSFVEKRSSFYYAFFQIWCSADVKITRRSITFISSSLMLSQQV